MVIRLLGAWILSGVTDAQIDTIAKNPFMIYILRLFRPAVARMASPQSLFNTPKKN
jgi:hypothetical protein